MTQLAQTNGGAITKPQAAPRRILRGEEEEDTIIPRLHIFQGLPAERDQYGDQPPGTIINTVSGEPIDGRKFVPIFGWVEWIRFREPRGSGIDYRTRDKSQIDPKDLEFDRASGKPPKATKFINFCVLVEGQDDPLCLSFKSTSLTAGKTINTLEKMRGAKGPGYYALELNKKSNSKGAWLAPRIRPLGDPPADMKELAEALFNSMSPDLVSTNVDADSIAGDGPDFDPSSEQ